MPVIISKGEMWDLFGDKAMGFAVWLNGGSQEAIAVKTMLENTAGIDLESPLVKNQVLPLLMASQVIDQGVVDRVDAKIAQASTANNPVSIQLRRYRVPMPSGMAFQEALTWASQYVSGDFWASPDGVDMLVDVPLDRTFAAPNAQEVT